MWAIGTRFGCGARPAVIPQWSGPGGLLPVGWEFHADGSKTPRMITATVIAPPSPCPRPRTRRGRSCRASAVDAADMTGITDLFRCFRSQFTAATMSG